MKRSTVVGLVLMTGATAFVVAQCDAQERKIDALPNQQAAEAVPLVDATDPAYVSTGSTSSGGSSIHIFHFGSGGSTSGGTSALASPPTRTAPAPRPAPAQTAPSTTTTSSRGGFGSTGASSGSSS